METLLQKTRKHIEECKLYKIQKYLSINGKLKLKREFE